MAQQSLSVSSPCSWPNSLDSPWIPPWWWQYDWHIMDDILALNLLTLQVIQLSSICLYLQVSIYLTSPTIVGPTSTIYALPCLAVHWLWCLHQLQATPMAHPTISWMTSCMEALAWIISLLFGTWFPPPPIPTRQMTPSFSQNFEWVGTSVHIPWLYFVTRPALGQHIPTFDALMISLCMSTKPAWLISPSGWSQQLPSWLLHPYALPFPFVALSRQNIPTNAHTCPPT